MYAWVLLTKLITVFWSIKVPPHKMLSPTTVLYFNATRKVYNQFTMLLQQKAICKKFLEKTTMKSFINYSVIGAIVLYCNSDHHCQTQTFSCIQPIVPWQKLLIPLSSATKKTDNTTEIICSLAQLGGMSKASLLYLFISIIFLYTNILVWY